MLDRYGRLLYRYLFSLRRALARLSPSSIRHQVDPWYGGDHPPALPDLPRLAPPLSGARKAIVPVRYTSMASHPICAVAAMAMVWGGEEDAKRLQALLTAEYPPPEEFILPDLLPIAKRLDVPAAYSYVWQTTHLCSLPFRGCVAIIGVRWSLLEPIYESRNIPILFPRFDGSPSTGDGHAVLLYGCRMNEEGKPLFRIADPANEAAQALDLTEQELLQCSYDSFDLGWAIEAVVICPKEQASTVPSHPRSESRGEPTATQ